MKKKETDLTDWLSQGNQIVKMARNKSAIPKTKKKQKKRLMSYKKKRKDELIKRATELETNLPKSEQWFRSLYKKNKHDRYNEVFGSTFIPDVINKKYKYIIEIDGSFHDSPERKAKDKKRDEYFIKRGYTVIRIEAYNQDSFDQAMNILKEKFNIYL